MSFAIYKGDKNMAELVGRLFQLQGKGSQTAAKKATDALLKANPNLKDMTNVPVGSIIAVPETVAPIQPSESVSESAIMRSAVVARSQASLDLVEQQFASISARAVGLTQSLLNATDLPELRAATKDSADLRRGLAEIITTTQEMLKDLEGDQAARSAEVNEIQSDLMTFIGH
jgi:hypothetical protein